MVCQGVLLFDKTKTAQLIGGEDGGREFYEPKIAIINISMSYHLEFFFSVLHIDIYTPSFTKMKYCTDSFIVFFHFSIYQGHHFSSDIFL